jgi:4-amino-4-deoxy-L-arabinose transferase-like glycosyltransferase
MTLLYCDWHFGKAPVKEGVTYGYELGQVARSIAAGEGFSSPLRMVHTGATAWFTPIYPYLVAGIFKLWGIYSDKSHIIIETLNCASSALTIIPIYAIGKRTFGRGVALASSWTWVFLPTALYFPIVWVWDTSVTALLFALIFWATLAIRTERRVPFWAGYGALCVVGVLTNPSVLAPLPFLAVWLVLDARKRRSPWVLPVGVATLVFVVGLIPWTVRNHEVFGKVIVLRSNFGLELWLGNNPQATDIGSPWMHPSDNPAEAEKYKQMGEIAYMAEKQREALRFMRTHPAWTLNLIFHRFVYTWLTVSDTPIDSWLDGPLYIKGLLVLSWSIALLSLLGVLFAYRSRLPEAAPFGLVLLTFPLVYYVTHSSTLRYRFPMDPIMVLLAAHGVTCLVSLARHRKTSLDPTEPVPSISAD